MEHPPRPFLRIAIHAHVFYDKIWPELLCCINNFIAEAGSANVDIILTYPSSKPELKSLLISTTGNSNTTIIGVNNRGYDIGPFMFAFVNKIDLSKYDYVVKLHTKRNTDAWMNFHHFKGPEWRDSLLAFCKTKRNTRRSIAALEKSPRIGMIAGSKIINYASSDLPASIPLHRQEMQELGLSMSHPVTVLGSIFMIRAHLLKIFQGRFREEDFCSVSDINAHNDYGLAGKLETIIPISVAARGYIISEGVFYWRLAYVGYLINAIVLNSVRKISTLTTSIIGHRRMLAFHRFLEK